MGNKGNWLIKHGAKAILTMMIGGVVTLALTVIENRNRLNAVEPKVEKQESTNKTLLRNQCKMLRALNVKGDYSECI